MSSTARPASRNASGVARPTRPALPCGLMLAAMLGAIRATEMPTACQTDRLRRRPVPGLRVGTAMRTSGRTAGCGVIGRAAAHCARRPADPSEVGREHGAAQRVEHGLVAPERLLV